MPTDTDLHKAAHNGDLAKCKEIIESKAVDVNEPGAAERRPLHRAAGGNHIAIIEYLLDRGALVDQSDKSGRTALHWAAISGHLEATQILLDHGCDMFKTTDSSCLAFSLAAEGGHAELVRLFIDRAKVESKQLDLFNHKDSNAKTAFNLASEGKRQAVCKILKDSGDPNAAGENCCIS